MSSRPIWTQLHARIHQVLRKQQLLPKKSRVLVAVSGGQDSLCLVKLLVDLQEKWGWDLGIGHCDHNWTTDEGIAAHVERISHELQLPFYLKTAKVTIPETEAAAREWRYQVLREIAREYNFDLLVTGHTLSDRAETFFYNLCRGAGADGLGALTWRRQLSPNLTLVRPLLEVTRSETYNFCQQFHLSIWEDQVNQQSRFARNRLRHDLIPYLKDNFNPQIELKIAQTSELLKAEGDYLNQIAADLINQVLTADKIGLQRSQLKSLHLALQRRVIRLFLQQHLPKSPNFEQIEAVVELIEAPNRSKTSTFSGGGWLEVQDHLIIFVV